MSRAKIRECELEIERLNKLSDELQQKVAMYEKTAKNTSNEITRLTSQKEADTIRGEMQKIRTEIRKLNNACLVLRFRYAAKKDKEDEEKKFLDEYDRWNNPNNPNYVQFFPVNDRHTDATLAVAARIMIKYGLI